MDEEASEVTLAELEADVAVIEAVVVSAAAVDPEVEDAVPVAAAVPAELALEVSAAMAAPTSACSPDSGVVDRSLHPEAASAKVAP